VPSCAAKWKERPLTPERWEQIRELFERALDSGDRDALLAEACRGDEELRREVESLLDRHSDSGDPVLDRPAWEIAGVLTPGYFAEWGNASVRAPRNLGKYRIVSLLGEGGMGAVYQAEQEHPRRIVALKVIRPGWASAELLRRFEQESQALGRLQHPGIAQIYEAGTADTGFGPQPYFAMEFIRGETLRDYAETKHLSLSQKMELMVKICEAVHHAHQRGLIHRDLKPGNILVDETGQPKILDFGVARAMDSDAQAATGHTVSGQLVGTLAYMSPEQVLADPLELDTRSDVYALGVILYELLAGRLPYQISQKLPEALQTIREEHPAPLSSISRLFGGDIETITQKALEKEKARRYGSAASLADDIRRFLRDEPILARPPSSTYQFKKFARRHRAWVAGTAAVFVVLVGGIAVGTTEAMRATRATRAALDQAATAKAVSDFLQNDLLSQASAVTQAGPDRPPDPDLKVRTALERAASRIAGKFDKQPLVEASIRDTVANAYVDLGLYPQAQPQVERALELRRRVLGTDHPDTLSSMNDLAQLHAYQGNYTQAEPLYTRVLEGQRRVIGEERPAVLTTMGSLAQLYLYQGKYAQAEALYSRTLEISRRVLGNEHIDTLADMTGLAVALNNQGKYLQAEALYLQILEISRRVLGDEHPDTMTNMIGLAKVYESEGRFGEAEGLYNRTLEISRRVLGEEHPNVLIYVNNLAGLYQVEGKYAQAQALYKKTLEVRRRVLGEQHPDTLLTSSGLARVYLNKAAYAQAEPLLSKVLEIQKRVLGEEHPDTLVSMADLAQLYVNRGDYVKAESFDTRILGARRRVLGDRHPRTVETMASLGEVRLRQRKYAEAEPLLTEALKIQQDTNADTWTRYFAQSLLGASLAGQKRYAEAEPLLVSGYLGMKQREATIPGARRAVLDEGGDRIVKLYEARANQAKAVEWQAKLRMSRSVTASNR
jgi:eukaryotic-like serine/threonine-protein kinase